MRRAVVIAVGICSLLGVTAGLAACHGGDGAATSPLPSATTSTTSPLPTASTSCSGDVLFGRPVPLTGLSDAQCQPHCSCGGTSFDAPLYGADDIAALQTWTELEPPAALDADPYAAAKPGAPIANEVCAVVPDPPGAKTYRVKTFASAGAAIAAGATPTHYGACGLCSSLVNLGVYMKYPDLTAPVRSCGLMGASGNGAAQVACIEKLGFEHACAQIWSYNVDHTRAACLDVCIAALGKPYQGTDGALNPCLQCDEDQSGAVFKAVAGRTRRNTGIASAICRPCAEVKPLVHEYR